MGLPQSPTEMQLQIPGTVESDPAALAALVQTTISSLEGQLAALQENIAQTSQALDALAPQSFTADQPLAAGSANSSTLPGAPLASTITQLEDQQRDLQGQIEVENAAKKVFTEQRDLAWQSLVALNNKHAEMLLTRAAANGEVRLSGLAVPPHRSLERVSLTISLALAIVAGLLSGILLAFVLEALNVPPLRSRGLQPAVRVA
jgi:hypothetical protein